MPSVIVPLAAAPDRNLLVNHRGRDADATRIVDVMRFSLDPRLFAASP